MRNNATGNVVWGKRNMKFGFLYLALTMFLGLYLADEAGEFNSIWAETRHTFLSNAYMQGNIDAVLNIIAGFLMIRLPFVSWLARLISGLMITGAAMHSGMFFMSGLGLIPFGASLIPLGSIIISAVMIFMGIGAITLKAVR